MTSINSAKSHVRQGAAATLAVAIAAAALLSYSQIAYAAPKDTAASTQAPTITFMSPDEYSLMYSSKFGDAAPEAQSISQVPDLIRGDSGEVVSTVAKVTAQQPLESTPSTPSLDPGGTTPWHHVLWSDTDKRGTYVPTRFGNSDLGYSHYSIRHNLITPKPFRAIRATTKPYVDNGAHLEYQVLVTNMSNGAIHARIRIVVQAATRTDDGRYTSPDGRNIGTITAYCEGMNRCPDWVNSI